MIFLVIKSDDIFSVEKTCNGSYKVFLIMKISLVNFLIYLSYDILPT